MKTYVEILRCPNHHDSLAVSFSAKRSRIRVAGLRGPCCGKWETIARIPMSARDWISLIAEADYYREQEEK